MAIWQKGRDAAIKSYRKRHFCKTAVKLRSNCGQNCGHYPVNWLRKEFKTVAFRVKTVLKCCFFLAVFLLFFFFSFLCFSVFYASYWSCFRLKIGDFTKGKVYLYVRIVANGHLYDCNGFYVLFEYILRLIVLTFRCGVGVRICELCKVERADLLLL